MVDITLFNFCLIGQYFWCMEHQFHKYILYLWKHLACCHFIVSSYYHYVVFFLKFSWSAFREAWGTPFPQRLTLPGRAQPFLGTLSAALRHRVWPVVFFFWLFLWPRWVSLVMRGIFVIMLGLCCPAAKVGCGIWVPWPGIRLASPASEGGVLTTGPPGKFHIISFLSYIHPT